MKKVMLLLSLSTIIVIGSTTDDTRYISGNISRIDWFQNSCTFKINEENSPSKVPNYRLCKILEQAYMRGQGVVVEIKDRSGTYYYSVNYLHRSATWAGMKVERESFTYQLFGTVEDIYYHTPEDRCYIAIDTGFASVRNNKHFHITMIWDICAKAINAFYTREKVIMMATVNLHTAYTNEIVDLKLAKCTD